MGPVNSLNGQDSFAYSLEEWKQGQGSSGSADNPRDGFIWLVILAEKEGF